MASILKGVKIIFTLIGGIQTIKDLIAGDAEHVITVDEMRSLVRGEHARFFSTITFADIEYIRDHFYNASLPSITSTSDITANDLKTGGKLYQVYQDLIHGTEKLGPILKECAAVFRNYQKDLHADELMSGLVAMARAYGLLIHIHATYAELHRIEIGAPDLDHPDLKSDTLAAKHYVTDAKLLFVTTEVSNQDTFIDWVIMRRQDYIGKLKPLWKSTQYWYFYDDYSPLSSTPSEFQLSPPHGHEIVCTTDLSSSEKQLSSHKETVKRGTINVLDPFISLFMPIEYTLDLLGARAVKQGLPPYSAELPQVPVTMPAQEELVA